MAFEMVIFRGKEYVLVPRERFERLTDAEKDRHDAAKVAKALDRYRAGRSKAAPLAQVKRRLGL